MFCGGNSSKYLSSLFFLTNFKTLSDYVVCKQGSPIIVYNYIDFKQHLNGKLISNVQRNFCPFSERRQTIAKVTIRFFVYFLIFKLGRVAKLILPTFPQFKSIANCSGQP